MESQVRVDLVRRAQSGNLDALTELYTAYANSVYRVAVRLMSSSGDAEDVVQDVFIGLPEALRKYEHRGDLGAWIRRVAARTALMKLRRLRRKAEVPLDATELAAPSRSETTRLTVETALSRLPVSLRAVFVLREIEGYSHGEIGGILGIGVGASKVRLHRARRLLRDFLEQHG